MTSKQNKSESILRLAMLTLTPAEAEMMSEQLVDIKGYFEFSDEGASAPAPIGDRPSNPSLLDRPTTVAIEISTA